MRRALLALVVGLTLAFAGLGAPGSSAGAATPGSPVGAFDNVSARFDNKVVLSGWAADPDAPGQPIDVHLYVGSLNVGVVRTGDARPDVAGALPGVGPSTGWHVASTELALPGLLPRSEMICAYGINVGAGANVLLGCHPLSTSGNSPFNPVGSLDSVGVAPGLIQLRGWAGDRDGDRTTQLRIYYDGSLMVEKTAALPRPDVAAAVPGVGPTTGFNLTLPILPGPHFVCVYAQNTGLSGLQNSTIGCVMRAIPGATTPGPHDPRGSIDGVGVAAGSFPRHIDYTAIGWAYDPDTGGPISVLIRGFVDQFFMDPPQLYQSATVVTGKPRPDVQAVVPGAGANSGFEGRFATTAYAGVSLACAYGVNVGAGSSRLLGCFEVHGVQATP